jgi:5-methylthioadenosine/S-adenosylhomocysteine deaminase
MSLVVHDVRLDGVPVSVRVADGEIVEIVEIDDSDGAAPAALAATGDRVLDGRGLTLTPGLVNAHTHAAMTLFRGYGDDLPLMDWLRTRIWPAEAALDADDVYWGTRLAALEMIRSGTTCFWDMYWFQFDVARAVVDSGLRAVVSVPVIETPHAPEWNRIDAVPDALDRLGAFGPRVVPSVAAHAIYTVGSDSLRRLGELSRTRDVALQIHLSETKGEVDDCVAAHGMRPTPYLDDLGALSDRTVLAHGVWLDDSELELVAGRGATIVTNPASNMKLGTGRAFPYPAARAAGVPIGIGTDGAASNNSLDLLQEVKLLALLQKHTSADPAVLPAAEAWSIATGRSAPRLGGRPIAVGNPADFLLVDLGAVESVPAEGVTGLVYSATGAAVDTVVVDGEVLMERRRVPDEAEVVANAARCAQRLRTALG